MNTRFLLASAIALALSVSNASAAFHIMQIEQIIGGIDGNTAAQAVQLRLRSAGQNQVGGSTSLIAYDAMGLNAVTLINIPAGMNPANSASGARILLTTPAFNAAMTALTPGFAPDYTLTSSIPASYLNGGKVTFQNGSTIYWSVAFGNYTGPNTGDSTNDPDGNFGAPFPGALPSGSKQGIVFPGAATTPSTMNSLDYALTADPAVVTRNNGMMFTVVPEPASAALLALGGLGLGGLIFARRRRRE